MIPEDDLLVQRCINGDRDAFGVLVDKYKDAVCGLAYSAFPFTNASKRGIY